MNYNPVIISVSGEINVVNVLVNFGPAFEGGGCGK